MKDHTVETKVHQSLITDIQVLLLKLGKALADHNHTWSDFERKLFDDISKRLHKIQKEIVKEN